MSALVGTHWHAKNCFFTLYVSQVLGAAYTTVPLQVMRTAALSFFQVQRKCAALLVRLLLCPPEGNENLTSVPLQSWSFETKCQIPVLWNPAIWGEEEFEDFLILPKQFFKNLLILDGLVGRTANWLFIDFWHHYSSNSMLLEFINNHSMRSHEMT
jgi:hypothetical protein